MAGSRYLQGFWYTIWPIPVKIETRNEAMRIKFSQIILLLLSFVFLPACGQKGPLFLPGDPSSLQSIPPASELQELSEEDDEDEEEAEPIPNRD
jgi:predicted small lipoprotein YifL